MSSAIVILAIAFVLCALTIGLRNRLGDGAAQGWTVPPWKMLASLTVAYVVLSGAAALSVHQPGPAAVPSRSGEYKVVSLRDRGEGVYSEDGTLTGPLFRHLRNGSTVVIDHRNVCYAVLRSGNLAPRSCPD